MLPRHVCAFSSELVLDACALQQRKGLILLGRGEKGESEAYQRM